MIALYYFAFGWISLCLYTNHSLCLHRAKTEKLSLLHLLTQWMTRKHSVRCLFILELFSYWFGGRSRSQWYEWWCVASTNTKEMRRTSWRWMVDWWVKRLNFCLTQNWCLFSLNYDEKWETDRITWTTFIRWSTIPKILQIFKSLIFPVLNIS